MQIISEDGIVTLEKELKLKYIKEAHITIIERSEDFGNQIAQIIFESTENSGNGVAKSYRVVKAFRNT
jgi:hypothetical protein